ncbi:hypothetical protein EUX98_g1330 [Antrodiella citrinella]|uniref:Uncharacterized protein n=1 Tax=Antrodiella citrinella TaxID=2447956 RepID=A0A4S4N415_9APHY|nr:hypothetical protein EUX98_g1330 [Antrodiella citrinella]
MFKKYLDRRPHRGKMSEDTTEPVKQLLNELAYGLKPGEPGFEGTGLGTGIVQMAMQPIVRPLDTPGTEFNVTGNVRDVVLARRFVYQLCERWHYILPQVEAMQSRLDSALSDMDDDGILAFDIDDALSSRRLLASPYMPYWTARGTLLAQSDWLSSSPAVICPGCGGAI